MSFGYKTAWFAFHTPETDVVTRALRLSSHVSAKAQAAIEAAYAHGTPELSGKAFVTPPLSGWTLVMSTGFFDVANADPAQFQEKIAKLSAESGVEVQFFATHRVVEAHTWARAVDGQLVRAYSYLGESGEKKVEIGDPTSEEVALNLMFFDPSSPDAETEGYWERKDLRYPDEEDVMRVAEKWSVNPSVLTDIPDGLLADMPSRMVPTMTPRVRPRLSKKPWWRFW